MSKASLLSRARQRYLDVLASVYIYNEHRGYTSLDRVLEAVTVRCADDPDFIAAVQKHRADERKHYLMFKRYFQLRGMMPYKVDRTCGHIDRFIEGVFGCTIDELDTHGITEDKEAFERLCRVIMLTEQRGLVQVQTILGKDRVFGDKVLTKIFEIIEVDEPDHFLPYQHWLEKEQRATAHWRERWTDYWIHKSLMFVKLPSLFFNRNLAQCDEWQDAAEAA